MRFSDFVHSSTREKPSRAWQALLDAAPYIVLVAVNALVAFGDWRLFTALRDAVRDPLAAAAAVAVSAAGFVLWYDLAAQYRYANRAQMLIAYGMSALSLGLAAYGWWVASAIEAGLGAVDMPRFYGVVTALTVAHVLAGLLWYASDDRTRLRRKASRAAARSQYRVQVVQASQRLLSDLRGAFEAYRALVDEYGQDAVADMLAALEALDDDDEHGRGSLAMPTAQSRRGPVAVPQRTGASPAAVPPTPPAVGRPAAGPDASAPAPAAASRHAVAGKPRSVSPAAAGDNHRAEEPLPPA